MMPKIPWPDNDPWIRSHTIFLTVHGSRSYGTSTPESDTDLKGIAIAPLSCYLGFREKFEHLTTRNPDMSIYGLKKFMRLAAVCSPNAIEFLFTDPVHHLIVTPVGRELLANRALFLSTKAQASFGGYAKHQLKDIFRDMHRGEEPSRNSKRVMHYVRLMRQCREILETGEVNVLRPDAEELLRIRNGDWDHTWVQEWAEHQEAEISRAAEHSPLPDEPDMAKLDRLCQRLILEFHRVPA